MQTMATDASARPRTVIESSDSEEDVPLSKVGWVKSSNPVAAPAPAVQNGSKSSHHPSRIKPSAKHDACSDSDDDRPLANRKPGPLPGARKPVTPKQPVLDAAEELLPAPKPRPKPKPEPVKKEESSDSEDNIPLAQRRAVGK